jgi:hypothetical protein
MLAGCKAGATADEIVAYVNGLGALPAILGSYGAANAFADAHAERLNAAAVAAAVREFADENYGGAWRADLEQRKLDEFQQIKVDEQPMVGQPTSGPSTAFARDFNYQLYSRKYRAIAEQTSFIRRSRAYQQLISTLPAHETCTNGLKLWYIRMEAAPSYHLEGQILIAAARTREHALRYFLERVGEPDPHDGDNQHHEA